MKTEEWKWLTKQGPGKRGRGEKKRPAENEEQLAPERVKEWLADHLPPRKVRESDELRPAYGRPEAIEMMIDVGDLPPHNRHGILGRGTGSELADLFQREGQVATRSNPVYGIGVKFGSTTGGEIEISDVVPYGPAHHSRRVLPGDVVVAVDGIKATLLSIKELCGACRGPHGTECRLRLSRKAGYNGSGEKCGTEFDVLLERGPNRHDEQIPRTTYRQIGIQDAGGIKGVESHRFGDAARPRAGTQPGSKARSRLRPGL